MTTLLVFGRNGQVARELTGLAEATGRVACLRRP
jgi:dTDP-4-dehydrorhamnose reductase